MKIAVINGNMRHGSTWHCMDAILEELAKFEDTEVKAFFLPKDMPHFCKGCFSCFYTGEDTCPHASYIKPIEEAILASDLIILTSPVYGLDVSGQMKTLIDHLCYLWMSHRPNPKMFNKIGLTISTSAGAGLGHTTKTMKNNLTFWGVKKIFSYKSTVSAMSWSDVSEKRKLTIKKEARQLASQIHAAVKNIQKLPNPLFRSFFFSLMSRMQKKNTWNLTDKNHWMENGWLSGNRPF